MPPVTPIRFLRTLLLWLTALLPLFAAAAEDFLPPEQAFRFDARVLDGKSIEIGFVVADGYYLYREPFKFEAQGGGVVLGAPEIPSGTVKFDETFEKDVETYRGRVAIRLPVDAAPASFQLVVTSQGCADQGLCYPPMQSVADVRLAGFGGDGSVRVPADGRGLDGALAASRASASMAGASRSGDAAIDHALRSGRFWLVVFAFFVAGLLLSFTPCVLPMLPILSSLIVGQGGQAVARSRGLLLAGAYSLGMALVYTALGVAAGLAGEGLAAALQNAWVLGAFSLLLALLALSMFGAYELQLPAVLRDRLAASSGRLQGGRLAGVFAMGGVSALIVSPCVAAPLAGALLYISQTRDVLLGGSALFSLAAGMSVPLLLLGASAGALLPRAGAWMESVKRFFGLLLLAVAWWMLSPVVPAPLAVAGWGVLLIGAAVFLHAFDRLPEIAGADLRLVKGLGLALAVAGATQIVGAAAGAQDALKPLQPFVVGISPAAAAALPGNAIAATHDGVSFRRVSTVEELDAAVRGAGRPVMLDFYADWCVSCKEMERFTFTDPAVQARLGKALLLQADVTRNSESDRALLKRFQLFGPPGIVFFDAGGRELETRVIGFQNAQRFQQSLQSAGL
ncbi:MULTISPECIES: protein-disulfide reductase DsbD [unclassified Methylibium]|uniref:protein-disulfide reductase DsbD n=1 Tax=unclassified Methylibium TaxID=2633235 RepID=UPI0003F41CBA|nr:MULTISPECIES: protein-disulfide reductase DsbD [unclassified Methylibium]EWS55302.1 Thiol:disulfide interchange protein DsbD precursor [Methylibium sp. T29]EWS59547.1 Thiol:disulfide interchange protein DsbD precursor [Methylibium sp. T29-B]